MGPVSYHDYRGIFVDEGEKKEIVRDLGPTNMVMNTHKIICAFVVCQLLF